MKPLCFLVAFFLLEPVIFLRADSPFELREEIEVGWRSVIAGYRGKSFEFKQEISSELMGIKSSSSIVCSVAIVDTEFIRTLGKTKSERVDPTGLDRRQVPDLSIIASLPKKLTKTEFATVRNATYYAVIDLANSPTISVLEEGRGKMQVQDLPRCYPGLCFGDLGTFVVTDLIWGDAGDTIPEGKLLVTSVEKKMDSVVLHLVGGAARIPSTLVLDSKREFTISRWELTRKWRAGSLSIEQTFEYADDPCHPSKIEYKELIRGTGNDDSTKTKKTECSALAPTTCSKSDCHLSAFGLPEPIGSTKGSLVRWAGVALIVFLAFSLIAWLKRSRVKQNAKLASFLLPLFCVFLGCSRDSGTSNSVELSLGEFSSQVPMDDFEVRATLTNYTSHEAKIHGVQLCCNLRLDKARSIKSVASNATGEIRFVGIVPNWEEIKDNRFDWNGKIFLETKKGELLTVPFLMSMQKPTP